MIMTTWWRGRHELAKTMETGTIPDELFLADIAETPLPRVSGTAVFMASGTDGMPNVLLHHFKHNKVLHEQVVLLSIVTENVPFAVGNDALLVRELGHGFYRVIARVGFMQQPDVPRILRALRRRWASSSSESDTTLLPRPPDAAHVGQVARGALAQDAVRVPRRATRGRRRRSSDLPPNRVVELGLQIEL